MRFHRITHRAIRSWTISCSGCGRTVVFYRREYADRSFTTHRTLCNQPTVKMTFDYYEP